MGGDADGLVDDNEVVVVVDDSEVGENLGNNGRRLLGLPLHLEPRLGDEAIALANYNTVDGYSPGLSHLGGKCAREAEKLCDCRVDPVPGEAVGNGKASGFHDYCTSSAGCTAFFS